MSENFIKEENEQLKKDINELVVFRKKLDEHVKIYNEKYDFFQKQNEILIKDIEALKYQLSEKEQAIRSNAVEIYNTTGNKSLYGGVGIRIMTKLEYDKNRAFEWANKHSMALTLDTKAFEQIAKLSQESEELSFVEIKKVPQATLPKEIKTEGEKDV